MSDTGTEPIATATVLLIDDHPLLRRGIAQLLALEPDLTLAGEAGHAGDGIRLATLLEPDLIVLDLDMPGAGGIETLRRLKYLGVPSRIVILTVSDRNSDVIAAVRAGADGYLLKDMEPEDIIVQLRRVVRGQTAISDELSLQVSAVRRDRCAPTRQNAQRLTPREGEILALIAAGLSNKRIARSLDISDGTVKVHVKHLLRKLALRSRVELAVWAVQQEHDGGRSAPAARHPSSANTVRQHPLP